MRGAIPQGPAACEYTVDELMIAALASQFRDGDQVCNGVASFIPVAALMLARLTHAPDLVWIASSVGVDPRPDRIPASTLESPLWRDSVMYLDQYTGFWDLVQKGPFISKFCVGAAQVDRFGNVNNSVIGEDFNRPDVRLPGTAGLADLCSMGKDLYYWVTDHSPRTLVEKVDFISGAGFLGGGDERERLGLKGGPVWLVTNLAVLDFHAENKQMQLKSLHPGVTLEQVRVATGFELDVPQCDLPVTPVPGPEQLRLIREVIDPGGMRKRGFKS